MNDLILNKNPYKMGQKVGEIFNKNKIQFLIENNKLPMHHKEPIEYLIYKYNKDNYSGLNENTEYVYIPIKLNIQQWI